MRSSRGRHDGFKTVGVSAPSERWVNWWSSPVRRGLPAILKSYTLCTAALDPNVDRGQHAGWGRSTVGDGPCVGSRSRAVCAPMMTHSMVTVRGATVGLCGC